MRDLETWFVRGGSVGAALYTFKQPGVYAYLNHNLIEAVASIFRTLSTSETMQSVSGKNLFEVPDYII